MIAGCDVASLKDIAAMKMTAIVQGATKRDYVDLHAILTTGRTRLPDVLTTMQRRFPRYDPSLSVRALRYFGDIDAQAMPAMRAPTSWETVKRELPRIVERELEHRQEVRGLEDRED